jgi:hypothetical protein
LQHANIHYRLKEIHGRPLVERHFVNRAAVKGKSADHGDQRGNSNKDPEIAKAAESREVFLQKQIDCFLARTVRAID